MSRDPARRADVECCDYCTRPGTRIGRDSGDVVCTECGYDQYDDPAYSLARLTPTTRRRYGASRP